MVYPHIDLQRRWLNLSLCAPCYVFSAHSHGASNVTQWTKPERQVLAPPPPVNISPMTHNKNQVKDGQASTPAAGNVQKQTPPRLAIPSALNLGGGFAGKSSSNTNSSRGCSCGGQSNSSGGYSGSNSSSTDSGRWGQQAAPGAGASVRRRY